MPGQGGKWMSRGTHLPVRLEQQHYQPHTEDLQVFICIYSHKERVLRSQAIDP